MLKRIELPPGIDRESTQYSASGRWYDMNNMRFRGGVPEVIGGWQRDEMYKLQGIGRASFTSRDYVGNHYQFAGTDWKYYVIVGGLAVDITPERESGTLTNPLTTNNSAFLSVEDAGHGLSVNDWVVFTSISDDPPVAAETEMTNAILEQAHGFQVSSVEDVDNYTLYIVDWETGDPVVANTTVSGDGGTVAYSYKVPSGLSTAISGAGWGAGVWSGTDREWGYAADAPLETGRLRRVYIDNFGEDVMFLNSGGPIYYWDTSAETSGGIPIGGTSGVAVDIGDASTFPGNSNTPVAVDSFLVSKRDGHCVALGCNDIGGTAINSLLVRWSDQSNPFDWTPTTKNTSGGQVLRVGSKIVGGVSTKDEVIIFTDSAVYSMRYLGQEPWFGFTLITQGVEIVSSLAAVNASNAVFFMGNDGFYTYSGTVSPLASSVSKYVFDDINSNQIDKVFASVNSGFSEVMWFYPSSGSFEPDRYVLFNYEENVWSIGSFDMSSLDFESGSSSSYARTSWRDAIVFDAPMSTYVYEYNPIATAAAGVAGATASIPLVETSAVMVQETGAAAQGGALDAFIESGDVDISDGERFSLISRIIPDLKVFNSTSIQPSVNISIEGRDFPGEGQSVISSMDVDFANGTYAPTGNNTSVRGRARSIAIKLSSAANDFQWRNGAIRFDIRPDGRR